MQSARKIAGAVATAAVLLAGCKRVDKTTLGYANAINAYYSAHPECLWPQPVHFPLIVEQGSDQPEGLDALVAQGLLLRSVEQKQMFSPGQQTTQYDLNQRDHSAWSPDPAHPGFGNFCYGRRNVQSIDSVTTPAVTPTNVHVAYHYTMVGTPSWAIPRTTQSAFPQLKKTLSGAQTATADLVSSSERDGSAGWQVVATGVSTP